MNETDKSPQIDHLDKKHHDTSPLTVVYANYQLGRVYQNLQQIRYALLIWFEAGFIFFFFYNYNSLLRFYFNIILFRYYGRPFKFSIYSKAETMFEKCYQSLKPKIPSALKSKNAETLQVWVNVLIEYAVFQMMQQHYDRSTRGRRRLGARKSADNGCSGIIFACSANHLLT